MGMGQTVPYRQTVPRGQGESLRRDKGGVGKCGGSADSPQASSSTSSTPQVKAPSSSGSRKKLNWITSKKRIR